MSKKKKNKHSIFEFPRNCKGTNISGASFEDLKAASDFYHKSDTAHYVERLDEIINQQGYKMSNWEVEQLNSMYEKFSAQYNSPLAKALK